MRRRHFAVAGLCALFATTASAQQQIENVAAFARLYGVARWFYPSDAAAALDWNRFAVDGVHRVRGARTPVELEPTLAGIRAGRDELLERALVALRSPR